MEDSYRIFKFTIIVKFIHLFKENRKLENVERVWQQLDGIINIVVKNHNKSKVGKMNIGSISRYTIDLEKEVDSFFA